MTPESDVAILGENTFRYARSLKIIATVGMIFFFCIAVSAFRAKPENGGGLGWPAVMFFLFGVANALFLWILLPTVQTNSEEILKTRFGVTSRLKWRDVQRVEHRPISSTLLLRSESDRLRIHRQIRGFVQLFEIMERFVPAGALGPPLALPFQVPASWNLRIVSGGMSCFFLTAGIYQALKMEYGSASFCIGFGIICIAALVWFAFLRFEFDESSLRIIYPARTVQYPIADLMYATIMQRDLDIVAVLQFGSKTVELSDNQVIVAPERIYESVVRAYNLMKPKGSE